MIKVLRTEMFKGEWWFEKSSHMRLMQFIIWLIILSILYPFFGLSGSNNLEIDELYEQAELIENDFNSVKTMDNVDVDFYNGKKDLILLGEKCKLRITFNNDCTEIVDLIEETITSKITDMFLLSISILFLLDALGLLLLIIVDDNIRIINTIFNIILLVFATLFVFHNVSKFIECFMALIK